MRRRLPRSSRSGPGRSPTTRRECSTSPTSSGFTPCAWRRGGCAPRAPLRARDLRPVPRRERDMKAKRVKKLDRSEPLADNAARIVRVRLKEMRSFVPRALEPGDIDAQHDMRIAAKRLRYVLESTEFCLGRPAQTARRRARDLQDGLGELH